MVDKKKENKTLTTAGGAPVSDNQNSETAGERGPVLMQDVHLLEKLATFARERIPERVVHAKGAGAYGTFTVTHDITKYTKAKIFSEIGKKTDMFARFSTVAGERGSADTVRDVRGFALKFYTEEGNWDLVGNNTPVFFVRDPLKFSDFIHTQKRMPKSNLRSQTMWWDFWSLVPEALHQITVLFSDRGIPKGFPHMNGYSSHTYSFLNADDERFWVKFHFKTNRVPGISFSPDKMLQGRLFSYADAHRYRLGVNYQSLPINRPKAAQVNTYHRDGFMRFDGNAGDTVVYEPNSFGGPKEDPAFKEPPLKISGDADRYNQPRVDADFIQPGNLYRLMPPDEQERLIQNLVNSLKTVPKSIQERMLQYFYKADSTWGDRIAKGLGIKALAAV